MIRDYKSSFTTNLRIKLQLAYSLQEANTTLPSKVNAAAWYRDYLLVTYSIIRSSVPLMQAAYDRCFDLQDIRLLQELRKYYKKHIKEEMGHDEWILDDLESIGVTRQVSLFRKPLQSVAELVGAQYYWIYHWHPVCLLGYISFLEGNPPGRNLIKQLQKITGYPETGFRTLIKHSDLDPHHREELNELLQVLPLNSKQEQWITSNALYSANKLKEIRNQPPSDL